MFRDSRSKIVSPSCHALILIRVSPKGDCNVSEVFVHGVEWMRNLHEAILISSREFMVIRAFCSTQPFKRNFPESSFQHHTTCRLRTRGNKKKL